MNKIERDMRQALREKPFKEVIKRELVSFKRLHEVDTHICFLDSDKKYLVYLNKERNNFIPRKLSMYTDELHSLEKKGIRKGSECFVIKYKSIKSIEIF